MASNCICQVESVNYILRRKLLLIVSFVVNKVPSKKVKHRKVYFSS